MSTHSGLPLTEPVYIVCILLLLIGIAPLIAGRLRIPPLVVLIILGTILGSNVLGLLVLDERLILLEKFGLLYIMLLAGIQMKLSNFRRLGVRSLILGLLTLATVGAVFVPLETVVTAQEAAKVVYGEAQPLGNGSVRTWVKLDNNGNPSDIGVSFTEAALSGLPEESDNLGDYPLKLKLMDGIGHSTFEYELLFPKEASATPFTHISLNWNPSGHAPEGFTTVPHYDFHFNMLTPEERDAIGADAPDVFMAKAYKTPPAELVAKGYVAPPMAAEPRMGVHYFNPTLSEFQRQFDKVFIYGFYDGNMAFWEPMITSSFLETKPNITDAIEQPAAYPKSSYYPTAYSVNYADGEYSVSLDGLSFRSSKDDCAGSPLKRRQKHTTRGGYPK